jgi:rubrerythrin
MTMNEANSQYDTFDLEKYLRISGATRPDAFDWSDPGPRLDGEALFCLGYMMDIESHTVIYMKELLSTSVAEDPSITAFLSCWVYEEFFHSQVLKRLLETQGLKIEDARFAELRRRKAARRIAEKIAGIASHMTRHFPAVHMTWGAINELSTLTGYHAMIERTGHPLIATVMGRIIKDERRHFSFYFNQARRMLQDPSARRLTSFLVRHFWTPVGSPVRGDADARRICAFLFPGEQGRARLVEMDTMLARLPGLEWFNLAERYCFVEPQPEPLDSTPHSLSGFSSSAPSSAH